jgi:hypothetical protein
VDSNIIIAAFTAGALSVKTAKQWQWDKGMILQISGVALFNGEPQDLPEA